MKRRIGILTSGGDCPGLNAAIRGVTRAAYELFDAEIVGIHDGYDVVRFFFDGIHGHCHGFCLRTFFVIRYQQTDRERT